ncbi:MAG: sigma-70 family RNA polymerase sigma factor, partial [Planctomycetales bacterium]|nr:sigma-70 family RNA polymerase sigma factor [Planctomycetales bacterium]
MLERCLARKDRAWEDFVDRFSGLVVHVVNHTARSRSVVLTAADREDLVSEVFLAIIQDNLAILRRFRGQSSLATYLTVISRRVVVRKFLAGRSVPATTATKEVADGAAAAEQRITDR